MLTRFTFALLLATALVRAAEPVTVFGPSHVEEIYRMILDRDALLLESITAAIHQHGIEDGQVLVTAGSVQGCTWHYVTSTALKPVNGFKTEKGPAEILSAGGIIAAGEPHLHITLSTPAKGVFGGHLEKGCRVLYLAEVTLVKDSGTPLTRKENTNGVSLLQAK